MNKIEKSREFRMRGEVLDLTTIVIADCASGRMILPFSGEMHTPRAGK
jgi:hypothetical protein